jgi:hypothetical protein
MKLNPLVREMSFYPSCFGEEEKTGDKIKVNFSSFPSGLQRSKYQAVSRKDGATSIIYDYMKIVLNHVKSIENLSIGNDKIVTPVQLCDYEDSRLFDLMIDIKNKLFEETEVLTTGE